MPEIGLFAVVTAGLVFMAYLVEGEVVAVDPRGQTWSAG